MLHIDTSAFKHATSSTPAPKATGPAAYPDILCTAATLGPRARRQPLATVIVGGFYGDEGKGKVVDALAQSGAYGLIARGGVGPNAGHTIVSDAGDTIGLRMLPSAVLAAKRHDVRLLIGAGVYVDPEVLQDETSRLGLTPRQVGVDRQAGVIDRAHKTGEAANAHLAGTIGSTKSGCGLAAVDRIMRRAPLAKDTPSLSPFVCDVGGEIRHCLAAGQRVLLEGTQAYGLSNLHGGYPFVTSKDTTASTVLADVGVGPTTVERVVVVFKAYVTRVGEGPLRGQLPADTAKARGMAEYGTVTGRARRAAPFDCDLAATSCAYNGATDVAITKLDILFPDDKGKRRYEDLTVPARHFVREVEERTGTPVTVLGTGPSASHTILRAPFWPHVS